MRTFLDFGGFRLDPQLHVLQHDGEPVALTPKAVETLSVLALRAGEVVSKDELLAAVWPDTHVEEATLTQNVYTLRKTLGALAPDLELIETVPRRGYRFLPPVVAVTSAETMPMPLPVPAGELPSSPSAASRPPSAPDVGDARPETESGGPRRSGRLLPWLLAALAIVIALALLLGLRNAEERVAETPDGAARPVGSLAVLPFATAGSDESFLGPGMADALINRLGRLPDLIVRPTSAVLEFADDPRPPPAIGRELGVEAVLSGSVERRGEIFALALVLTDVGSGEVLWREEASSRLDALFADQDRLAERVAEALRLHLTQGMRRRLTRSETATLDAYTAYLRGRFFWNKRTAEGLEQAIDYFERALAQDPEYAAAWAGLADSYLLLPLYSEALPVETLPLARSAALRALELDPTLAEAHTSLAYVRYVFEWNWAGAETAFRRAREINPGYATAHHWSAIFYSALGRHDEAIASARRALEVDPLSLVINTDLGFALYFAARFDEALAQLDRTLELDPEFAYAFFVRALVLSAAGEGEAAIADARRAAELSGRVPAMLAVLGHVLGREGREAEARGILGELDRRARAGEAQAGHRALVLAGLGERELAAEALWRASRERSRFVCFVRVWPAFSELRDRPRVRDLIATLGLDDSAPAPGSGS